MLQNESGSEASGSACAASAAKLDGEEFSGTEKHATNMAVVVSSVAGALTYTLDEAGAAQAVSAGQTGASFTSPTATSTVANSDDGPAWLKSAPAKGEDTGTSVIFTSKPTPAGCDS